MVWPDNSLAYIHLHFKLPNHLSKPDHKALEALYLYCVVYVCLATEYSVHLVCDHNESEYNDSIQLVLDDHNGSFGSLVTE